VAVSRKEEKSIGNTGLNTIILDTQQGDGKAGQSRNGGEAEKKGSLYPAISGNADSFVLLRHLSGDPC